MEEPKIIKEIVGKSHVFSGGIFSAKHSIEDTEFMVLDWRWGRAVIVDVQTLKKKHPTIEFLLKKDGMRAARWSKPFPCKEYVDGGEKGWIKSN